MKKLLLLSLVLLCGTHFITAQTLFRGVVLNEQTKQPIAQAKIGVSDQGVGVITSTNGRFNYKKYSKTLDTDSKLIVSAVGFEDLVLGVEEVRAMYNLNTTILLSPGSKKKREKQGVVSVFWDVSEGMIGRDEDKEWAFLEKHLSQYKEVKVNFIVFNDKIQSWKQEEIRNGDVSRLRQSIKDINYSGPANYDLLEVSGIDEALLFSNGSPTFGALAIDINVPVYAIASTTNANEKVLSEIADFTDGEIVDLENQSLQNIRRANDNLSSKKESPTTLISGTVTSLDKPLQGAILSKLGTFEETKTDANGGFNFQAVAGDIIAINYLGMFEKRVVVEDKSDYSIDLIPESDVLDEVVLTGTKQIIVGNKFMEGRPSKYFPGGTTGFGDFYITAEDIIPNARTLEQVLLQNFNAVQIRHTPTQGPILVVRGSVPQYVVNGNLLGPGEPPPFYIADTEIESLVLKYGIERTSRYSRGTLIGGVAIIVTTKNSSLVRKTDKYNPLVKGNDYNEDVPVSNQLIVSNAANRITGKVTSLGKPIQKATINIQGSFDEYYSEADGSFALPAQEGDVITISYLGMYTKGVEISSSDYYEVDLEPKSDVLDEVVLNGEGRQERSFNTPTGKKNFDAIGYDIKVLTHEELSSFTSLSRAINGRFAGVTASGEDNLTVTGARSAISRKMLIVIDGQIFDNNNGQLTPAISPSRVKILTIIKGLAGTTRYGSIARGGVVEIETTDYSSNPNEKVGSALVTNNDYKEEIKSLPRRVTSTRNSGGKEINAVTSNIRGRVTSLGKPIQKATINIEGSFDEYYSEADGSFAVPAQEGDVIVVSYLGMYPKGVAVEREDQEYVIDLVPKNEVLDEVALEGKQAQKRTVKTATGERNFDAVGYDIKEIKEEEIGSQYRNLASLINGRFAGVSADVTKDELWVTGVRASSISLQTFMLIVIDGQIFNPNTVPPTPAPVITPDRVKRITIIKGLAGTNRYGTLGRGGVVEIETTDYSGNTNEKVGSALVTNNDYKEETKSLPKRISPNRISVGKGTHGTKSIVIGRVTSLGKPLPGASLYIKGSFDEYYSKNDGSFELMASSGDIIVVNALGMFKKEILIEKQFDITIELTPKSNNLDEIVVSGNKRIDNTIETAYGKENQDKLGYSVDQISSEDFLEGATSLRQLITGKFPGVRVIGGTTGFSGSSFIYQIRGGNQSIENDIPPVWIVNGVATDQEPDYIDVTQIENISVLKSTIATNKYGTIAAGGAFVITTKGLSGENNGAAPKPSALVSGNNYVNDAISAAYLDEQDYIKELRQIPEVADQFEAYRKMARTKELSLEFYSDMARYFQEIDLQRANDVRSDLAYVARKNPKALRTLAYLYEEAGDVKKTLLSYEKVLALVPNEAQSYRDLANAFVLNQEYNKALEVYINALGERIKGVDFTGIEKVLKTELSRLVQLYKDKIEFTRLPNEWLRADFKQDVRMVIEWTDTTVPFEFQFVNPEKKFFKWNHTLEENRDRLIAEQKQGFQIEEFVIDDAPQGEWIINVQYLGEVDDYILPPFLKYTLYRDYGTPNETKEVRVIKLFRQTEKVTLAKLEI